MEKSLFTTYLQEQEEAFSGWDFSRLTSLNRFNSSLLPWSYGGLAYAAMQQANAVLDMGTGGGEFFSRLHPYPPIAYATEGYAPNLMIARQRLSPLGVTVVFSQTDENIPIPSSYFDLILNQHDSFSVNELERLLQPGGTFLTQQVGGKDCSDLNKALGAKIDPLYSKWDLDHALAAFSNKPFHIQKALEKIGVQRFYDIGAVIYYLKAIPWQIPDFSVEKYKHPLQQMHEHIQRKGYIDFIQHRFLIEARLL